MVGGRGKGSARRRLASLRAATRCGGCSDPKAGVGFTQTLGALLGLCAGLLLSVLAGFFFVAPQLPDPQALTQTKQQARITLLAADGSILDERSEQGPAHLSLGEISPWLVKAVLAVEDRRFYSHFGFDVLGTARAALRNLLAGEYVAGGSTITQQLAKNLYLSSERTLLRKLREFYLALWLEIHLSKDEILELYLNRAYFGAGAHGIAAAARTYFGKPAYALDLAEAAMLAGLLKAPSDYAPTSHPEAARRRRAVVLQAMVEAGAIDQRAAEAATAQPLRLAFAGTAFAGHFLDGVRDQLAAQLGVPDEEWVVRTTLDPEVQRAAIEALQRRLAPWPELEGAVIVLDYDGAVRALVGGRDWRRSQLDRATRVRRQPGSVFKIFVYASALRSGLTPAAIVEDRPVAIDGWQPRNPDGRYVGRISLEEAFARSSNAVAVELAQQIGLSEIARLARRLGIASELRLVPSLALGTSELSLIELARAFLPFVNGGHAMRERSIERVQDGAGNILFAPTREAKQVLDGSTLASMQQLLRAVVERGTGRRAAVSGRRVFGKTGTSQNGRDGWFVGSEGRYVVAVWVGRDDHRPVRGLAGGNTPALIARDIIERLPAPRAAKVAPATPTGEKPAPDDRLQSLLLWVQRVFGR